MPKFHVARSTEINVPPEQVFDLVADFNSWPSWSPWLCTEPDAKLTFSDKSSEVGSWYSWEGELVGAGEIEHKKLDRPSFIEEEIRFSKPFKSTSKVTFEIKPTDTGSHVTWNMLGSLPFFMFWMKSMMETFIGADYERGLRMLKEKLETGSVLSQTTIHGVKPVGPMSMAGVRRQCNFDDVASSMESAMHDAISKLESENVATTGEAMSVYYDVDMKARTFDYAIGLILKEGNPRVPDGITHWTTPEVRALNVEHLGKYHHLGNAWSTAYQVARTRKHKLAKVPSFEIYRNDPSQTPEAELKTDIYLPIK